MVETVEKKKESKHHREEDENEEDEDEDEDSEDLEDEEPEDEEISEELINEWIHRGGRVVDFDVSALETGVQRPMTQIRLERAMEEIPTGLADKQYVPSHGYESGSSYESKTVYSPAQEPRAPILNQGQSDFFATPTIVVQQPSQPYPQQQTQNFNNQQNQWENQKEEEAKKQNRRF